MMRCRLLVGTVLVGGAAAVVWLLAGRPLAEIEAELDRPDLERFAVARTLAELEGGRRRSDDGAAPPRAA